MFYRLREIIFPRVFSGRWLQKNSKEGTLQEIELRCKYENSYLIYHATDQSAAVSIWETRSIFGIDVVNSAHFHHKIESAKSQSIKNIENSQIIALGFIWRGPREKVNLSNDRTTHSNRSPNILFDVPCSEFIEGTWELRLYPGTDKYLSFEFIIISEKCYFLNEPISVHVLDPDK